ncbi:hypothetical protein ABDD95_00275 [Mucilaginibacter sp. PAMB04274]|uniref:hypothetical protein n=1 Tax=Mucilaginibacter sp. PAMB04274 TaxID=3138568 RepID=UPI0031F71E3C
MKLKNLLLLVLLMASMQLYAQERSVFRKGYLRLGLNQLGSDLSPNLTPRENIFDGRFGAGTGYVLEQGHIYYFKKNATLINYGLDWTIISLNYNKMDEWENYAMAAGAPNAYVDGTKIAAAASTKLGPVISFNPLEKLVVDLRFQIAPTLRFFDFNYSDGDENTGNDRYFSFTNNAQDDFDGESVKNRISFGVATNFGITLRRQAIGLSLDYVSGKVNSNYEAYDSKAGNTFGKQKIPAHNLQLKLSFTL